MANSISIPEVGFFRDLTKNEIREQLSVVNLMQKICEGPKVEPKLKVLLSDGTMRAVGTVRAMYDPDAKDGDKNETQLWDLDGKMAGQAAAFAALGVFNTDIHIFTPSDLESALENPNLPDKVRFAFTGPLGKRACVGKIVAVGDTVYLIPVAQDAVGEDKKKKENEE